MAERSLIDLTQAHQITAPNGAVYNIVVDNTGTFSTTLASGAATTDAVALWKASQYTGSGALTDLSGKSHDLAFPGGSNDPKFLQYSSTRYVYFPGVNGNNLTVPNAPALNITGDIDIRAKVALDDWTPAIDNALVTKYVTAGSRSYGLWIGASGSIHFEWSADGTNVSTANSTVATGATDGQALWVRATLDIDNGASGKTVMFYTSTDGIVWTQLGSPVTTAGTTSIFASTVPVEIGTYGTGTGQPASGKFYRAQILDGINGTVALDVDCTAFTNSSTTLNNGLVSVNAARSSFVRSSDAYLRGTQITSGVPRYTTGRNLLQLDANTNINNWNLELTGTGAATYAFSSDYLWNGIAPVKLTVTDTSSNSGYPRLIGPYPATDIRAAVQPGDTYISSFWVYSPVATTIDCSFYLVSGTKGTQTNNVPAGVWTRISSGAYTVTASDLATYNGTTNHIRPRLTWHNLGDLYVTAPQIEKSGTLSDWRQAGANAIFMEETTTNLLTAASSSFEDGSTGSWAGNAGAPSVTNTSAQAWTGTKSLLIVPSSTVTNNQVAFSPNISASASTAYSVSLYIFSDTAISSAFLGINFYNGATYLGQSSATGVAIPANVWTRITQTGTTVATTNLVGVTLNGTYASGQNIYIDGVQIEQKDFVTTWQLGGTTRQPESLTVTAGQGLIPFDVGSMEAIFTPGVGWTGTANGAGDGWYRVVGHSTTTNSNEIQILRQSGTSQVGCSMSNNAGSNNGSWAVGATAVTAGVPVYVCMTWDATNIKFYVNGVLKATQAITNRPTVWGTLGLGTHPNANRRLNGELDVVRISNIARTQTEITAAATAMNLSADSSTTWFQDFQGSFTAQANSVATINRSTSGRKSVVVDRNLFLFGTDDYLQASDHPDLDFGSSDSFTVAVAVRVHTSTAVNGSLIAKQQYGTGPGWRIQRSSVAGSVSMKTTDNTNTTWTDSNTSALPDRVATVIVGRRKADLHTFQLLSQGVQVGTATDLTGSLVNTLPLRIGSHSTSPNEYADMEFIGAAVWRRALTDAEISNLNGEFL